MKQLCKLVGACLSAVILAACGGGNSGLPSSTPLSLSPRIDTAVRSCRCRVAALEALFVRRPPTVASYKVLHSFGGGTDGQYPAAKVTVFKGSLYGTT